MEIKLKDASVSVMGFCPELVLGIMIVKSHIEAYEKQMGRPEMVITSGSESTAIHGASSMHYAGRACDIRSKNLHPSGMVKQNLASMVNTALGPDFDFFLEAAGEPNEHFHLEWQPKRRG